MIGGAAARAVAAAAPATGPGNITDEGRCDGGVLGGVSIGRTSAKGERIGDSPDASGAAGGIVGGSDGRPAMAGVEGAAAGIAPVPANAEPASARTRSLLRAKRSSGRLERLFNRAASVPGGSVTPSDEGSGTGLCTCAMSAESGLSVGKGWRPTSIWYAMSPSAY